MNPDSGSAAASTSVGALPTPVRWLTLGLSVLGAVVLAFGLSPLEMQPAAVGLALVCTPLVAVAAMRPLLAIGAWLFATATFNVLLFSVAITVGSKIYLLDLVCLGAAVAASLYLLGKRPGAVPRVGGLAIGAIAVVGAFLVAETARGFAAGHPLSDTLGTLRRMFVYPAAGFAIGYAILDAPANARIVTRSILASCGALALLFAVRAATGVGYRAEAFEANRDVIRYLSYPEALTLIVGATLALGRWSVEEYGPARRAWLLSAFACVGLVIASNYRTSWLALGAGLVSAGIAASFKSRGRGFRVLAAGVVGSGVLAAAVALTPLGDLLAKKLSVGNLADTGKWRLFSWLKAWQVFRAHPLLGVGFGYRHTFWYPGMNLQSANYVSGNEIHNDALWILVNSGTLGLLIWLGAGSLLLLVSRRALKQMTDPVVATLVCAAWGMFGAVAVTSMLQPTLSLGGTAVWVGAMAALLVRSAQWARRGETPAASAPTAAQP